MQFAWLRGRGKRQESAPRRFQPQLELLEDRTVPSGPPTAWLPGGTGGGGALFAPSFGYQNTSELYIASDMSQLFHSTNTGASWDTVSHQEIQGNHGARVQFTNNASLLYCIDFSVVGGVDLAQPAKSTDGGVTWTVLAGDLTGGEAYALCADPNNPNNVLVSDYTHLYFSSNGGTSFSQKYVTSDTSAGLHIAGAFFDGNNIYVGTNKGLLVSTDGGANFAVSSVGGIPAAEALVSFAGAKQNGTTRFFGVTLASGSVYAGITGADFWDYRGVYKLDVGQANWTPQVSGLAGGHYPFFVAMAQNNIDVAYLAGGSEASAPIIYKTTNGGTSWQSVLLTNNNQNVATGWSGHGGDRGWSYGEYALGFAVAPTDASRVVITDLGFAHLTTDGGTSWRQAYVNPADQNPANAPTPTGHNYRSSGLDNTTGWGVTWADANHLISSNSDIRGQISADGGQSWSFGYTGHTMNSMYRALKHPASGVLYAAVSSVHDMYQSTYLTDAKIDGGDGEVLYSTNQGVAWQRLHDFNHPVIWGAADPNTANRLYASVIHSTQGGVYVSSDIQNGSSSTWTKLTNPPRTEGHAFNVVVLNDGTLVASYSGRRHNNAFTASSGVFVSTNGGTSWLDRSHTGMQYWTKDVVIDPHDATQNTWYAGVFSGWGGPPNGLGGLYKTTNRGQTWTRIWSGDSVTSLTISPTDGNEAYLTSRENGLWFTNNLSNASPTFTQLGAYPFRQPERVFFNPYNANEIWTTSFGGGLRVGTTAAAGSLQFNAASYSVNENGGTATITVSRTNGSDGAVGVNYATSNGTASAGSDYTAANGTLTFNGGETSKTFTVTIFNDSVYEGNETVNLTLSNPTGGATLGSPASATLAITDDELAPAGQLQLSAGAYSVWENGGPVTLTVTRTNGSAGRVTVNYRTADLGVPNAARGGADYRVRRGTLTFRSGETTKTFTVPILNDTRVEPDEVFGVAIYNITGGATLGDPGQAVVTIREDDSAFQFSAASYVVTENVTFVDITVMRLGNTENTATVNYQTSDQSATAGSDYLPAAGTLTFATGETSKTVRVTILDDAIHESVEAIVLALSNPTGGAKLGVPASAVLAIEDDDPA